MEPNPLTHVALPPAQVHLSDDENEVYAVTLWAVGMGLVTHLAWIPLFAALQIWVLATLNVLSVAVFAAAAMLCRAGRLGPALIVATAEVVVHAWAATWVLGWETSFHLHALLGLILGIHFTTTSFRRRILFATAVATSWLLLALLSPWFPDPHPSVGRIQTYWLTAMNGLLFAVALSGITLYYSWRVTRTGQRQAEAQEQLSTQVNKTRVIVEHMEDGLIAFTPALRISALNRSLASWLDEEEVDGDDDVTARLSVPALYQMAQRAMDDGEVSRMDIPFPNGMIGAAVATPLDGEGVVIVVRDVTQEKAVDRMKSEFTAMVSHELRTPLTSILGFAKLVERQLNERLIPNTDLSNPKVERAAERSLEQLDVIVSEGERMTRLINDVLDLAKMESGQLKLRRETLEIPLLVDRTLASTQSLFSDRPVTCTADLAENLPKIKADPGRLQQLLVNLISNAARFTREGSVTLEVTRDPDGVRFAVVDTGPGIPLVEQDLVFQKFRQAGHARAMGGGTGLGLPICREIVEAHRGRIGLDSEVGVGSRFWFVLPAPTGLQRPDAARLSH